MTMENLGHYDVVCGDVDDNNGSSDIGMVMVDGIVYVCVLLFIWNASHEMFILLSQFW